METIDEFLHTLVIFKNLHFALEVGFFPIFNPDFFNSLNKFYYTSSNKTKIKPYNIEVQIHSDFIQIHSCIKFWSPIKQCKWEFNCNAFECDIFKMIVLLLYQAYDRHISLANNFNVFFLNRIMKKKIRNEYSTFLTRKKEIRKSLLYFGIKKTKMRVFQVFFTYHEF